MSVLAGRRFWFPFGPFNYYPHIYVVLVGDPGVAKSAAMDRSKNLVRAVGCCPLAATQTTKEAITLEMSSEKFAGRRYFTHNGKLTEYNQFAIFATELTQFISVNPYGMIDFLTTLWTEPVYEVRTKHQGNDYIMGPYLTLCACLTPETVKGYLKQSILTSGFARRTAWIFSNYSNIVHIPSYTPEQQECERLCVEFGKALQDKCGPFDWTPELKDYYIQWNTENERTKRDRPFTTRGWFESKGEMLFKISMLVALANEGGHNLMLDVPHYKLALHYCALAEKNMERVFEGAGINPNGGAVSQICAMLEGMDRPVNKKIIMSMFYSQVTSLNELKDTIDHLIQVGRLAEKQVVSKGVLLGTLLGSVNSITMCKDSEAEGYLRQVGPSPSVDPLQDERSSSNLVLPGSPDFSLPTSGA